MSPEMNAGGDERSLGQLFAELTRETSTLIHQEVELAKTEVTQKVTAMGRDVGMMAAGGLVAYIGTLVLVATLVIVLATLGLPWWAAALIVGVVLVGVGLGILFASLNKLRHRDLVPRETVETLKEDAKWAKGEMNRQT